MARKRTTQSPAAASWARETAHAGVRPRAGQRGAGTAASTKAGAPASAGARLGWWSALPASFRTLITGLLVVAGSSLAGLALLASSQHGGVLAVLGAALVALLGWGAYPLVAGLLCGGLARMAEGALRRPAMRRMLPLQGLALWLLVLAWSHLLRGGHTGGSVGTWLAHVIGLLPLRLGFIVAPLTALILTFAVVGITWGQAAACARWLAALVGAAALRAASGQRTVAALPALSTATASAPRAPQTPAAPEVLTQTANPAGSAAPSQVPAPALSPAGAGAAPRPFALEHDTAREWALPAPSVFEPAAAGITLDEDREIDALADRLERTLRSLRVEAEVRREDITVGPMVVRFGIRPLERRQRDGAGRPELDADGEPVLVRTRVSRILALQSDLALALQVPSLRMEAPVPGQPYVGVEVPNPGARPVGLREVLWSEATQRGARQRGLMIALGRDVTGHARLGDLSQFPHALIAGATGSGKSVCLHSIICSLLATRTPADLRLLLIDPKLVELSIYEGVPHLLLPVITDVDDALDALQRAIAEMRRRFALFARLGVRNLESYRRARERQPDLEPLPSLVIVVDEVANLMLAGGGRAEELLCTLAQLARAAGIHLVIATQRPSVDVVTGTIKANFPARLAFAMASSADSRTILDAGGAEHLLGRGDMLFVSGERARPERIQGCRVLDDEIERLVAHWAAQHQPERSSQRNPYGGTSWPTAAPHSAHRAGLDDDDTIEARQAGGRTRWGWGASDHHVEFDDWR